MQTSATKLTGGRWEHSVCDWMWVACRGLPGQARPAGVAALHHFPPTLIQVSEICCIWALKGHHEPVPGPDASAPRPRPWCVHLRPWTEYLGGSSSTQRHALGSMASAGALGYTEEVPRVRYQPLSVTGLPALQTQAPNSVRVMAVRAHVGSGLAGHSVWIFIQVGLR